MIRSRFALDGRRALVTGASEGIGRAITLALAEFGADVAVHALHAAEAGVVERDVAALGRSSVALAADLAMPGAATTLAERATALLGPIDILVSTVAIQHRLPYHRFDDARVMETVRINFAAAFELVRALGPAMAARGWGRVLTVGSVQERRPHAEMPVYAAMKAAQSNLVRNLARQNAGSGVTYNNLAPGVVDTRRNTAALADAEYRSRVLAAIPAGYVAAPEDMAGAAVLLCSDAGRYITGQDLYVDGGMAC